MSKKSKTKRKAKRANAQHQVTATRNVKRAGFVLDLGPGTIKIGDVEFGKVSSVRISEI